MDEKHSSIHGQSAEKLKNADRAGVRKGIAKEAVGSTVNLPLTEATALVLAGALALGGQTAAFAETDDDAVIVEAAHRVNQMSNMAPNPTDTALEAGRITIDSDQSLVELNSFLHEYEPGAFQYDPEATCHVRDAQWLAENGQPSAYIKLVYERSGLDPETATLEQKIDAFKDAMADCYTKDPYIFAGNKLMLEHSTDGVAINQDMINAYGDALSADPERWQDEYEDYMDLFESSENTCSVGRAEAGTHMTTYTSNVDSPDGRYRIYMGGPSRISTDVLILQLPNGQSVAFKECLQPAWNTGTPLEIPSGGVPNLIVDLPVIDTQLCEPDGFPVIVPPVIPVPKDRITTPVANHPGIPPAIVSSYGLVLPPDYAAMTGGGIDKGVRGEARKGYGTISRHHKQPTHLNDGNFSGNRSGRGRTSTVRTPNARRGR